MPSWFRSIWPGYQSETSKRSVRLPDGTLYQADRKLDPLKENDVEILLRNIGLCSDTFLFYIAKCGDENVLAVSCYPESAINLQPTTKKCLLYALSECFMVRNLSLKNAQYDEYIQQLKNAVYTNRYNLAAGREEATALATLFKSEETVTKILSELLSIPELTTLWIRIRNSSGINYKLGVTFSGLILQLDFSENVREYLPWSLVGPAVCRSASVLLPLTGDLNDSEMIRDCLATSTLARKAGGNQPASRRLLLFRLPGPKAAECLCVQLRRARLVALSDTDSFPARAQSDDFHATVSGCGVLSQLCKSFRRKRNPSNGRSASEHKLRKGDSTPGESPSPEEISPSTSVLPPISNQVIRADGDHHSGSNGYDNRIAVRPLTSTDGDGHSPALRSRAQPLGSPSASSQLAEGYSVCTSIGMTPVVFKAADWPPQPLPPSSSGGGAALSVSSFWSAQRSAQEVRLTSGPDAGHSRDVLPLATGTSALAHPTTKTTLTTPMPVFPYRPGIVESGYLARPPRATELSNTGQLSNRSPETEVAPSASATTGPLGEIRKPSALLFLHGDLSTSPKASVNIGYPPETSRNSPPAPVGTAQTRLSHAAEVSPSNSAVSTEPSSPLKASLPSQNSVSSSKIPPAPSRTSSIEVGPSKSAVPTEPASPLKVSSPSHNSVPGSQIPSALSRTSSIEVGPSKSAVPTEPASPLKVSSPSHNSVSGSQIPPALSRTSSIEVDPSKSPVHWEPSSPPKVSSPSHNSAASPQIPSPTSGIDSLGSLRHSNGGGITKPNSPFIKPVELSVGGGSALNSDDSGTPTGLPVGSGLPKPSSIHSTPIRPAATEASQRTLSGLPASSSPADGFTAKRSPGLQDPSHLPSSPVARSPPMPQRQIAAMIPSEASQPLSSGLKAPQIGVESLHPASPKIANGAGAVPVHAAGKSLPIDHHPGNQMPTSTPSWTSGLKPPNIRQPSSDSLHCSPVNPTSNHGDSNNNNSCRSGILAPQVGTSVPPTKPPPLAADHETAGTRLVSAIRPPSIAPPANHRQGQTGVEQNPAGSPAKASLLSGIRPPTVSKLADLRK